MSGQGTFSLGAGTLQALSPDPLRRVAATAAKKTINADKDEIAAEAKSVRDKITKGSYKFAPAQFAFDIKNGTLRLTPATLTSANAETKINGYIELASLKLDSEWAVSLAGASSQDVPPVSLVFTGALNKAGDISPAVDTAAIEAYLTMRRMQEGVEQLETLDVSGRSEPAARGSAGRSDLRRAGRAAEPNSRQPPARSRAARAAPGRRNRSSRDGHAAIRALGRNVAVATELLREAADGAGDPSRPMRPRRFRLDRRGAAGAAIDRGFGR